MLRAGGRRGLDTDDVPDCGELSLASPCGFAPSDVLSTPRALLEDDLQRRLCERLSKRRDCTDGALATLPSVYIVRSSFSLRRDQRADIVQVCAVDFLGKRFLAASGVSECECAGEAGVDLGHEPVWHRPDPLFESAAVDRRDLRDVED